MNFKERIDGILNYLKYCEEEYVHLFGTKISSIKDIFLRACDALVMDSDIRYLFENGYVEYWYNASGMDEHIYIHGLDTKIKITAKGVKYLEEESKIKKAPPKIIQLVQDEMMDSAKPDRAVMDTAGLFKQIYDSIDSHIKDDPQEKALLIQHIKEFEEELKKNNIQKVKEKINIFHREAKFLLPLLEHLIVTHIL